MLCVASAPAGNGGAGGLVARLPAEPLAQGSPTQSGSLGGRLGALRSRPGGAPPVLACPGCSSAPEAEPTGDGSCRGAGALGASGPMGRPAGLLGGRSSDVGLASRAGTAELAAPGRGSVGCALSVASAPAGSGGAGGLVARLPAEPLAQGSPTQSGSVGGRVGGLRSGSGGAPPVFASPGCPSAPEVEPAGGACRGAGAGGPTAAL